MEEETITPERQVLIKNLMAMFPRLGYETSVILTRFSETELDEIFKRDAPEWTPAPPEETVFKCVSIENKSG